MSLNSASRSSLEQMLESLQQRENEKPKDSPPVLPARPRPTSRRLPSPKRRLPTSSDISESDTSSSNCKEKKGDSKGSGVGEPETTQRSSAGILMEEDSKRVNQNTLGSKKIKDVEPGESQNVVVAFEQKDRELQLKDSDIASHAKQKNCELQLKEREIANHTKQKDCELQMKEREFANHSKQKACEQMKEKEIANHSKQKDRELQFRERYNTNHAKQKDRELQLKERDNAYHAKSPPRSLPRSWEPKGFGKMEHVIKQKLRVWCRVHNTLWESGQIQSASGERASILLTDGRVVTVSSQELLLANPDILEGVDDLMQLSYLNEPSVLHNLQHRYFNDIVYSKAGRLLLAVNPCKDLQLYGNNIATAYRKKLVDRPHVYAVVDNTYNEMMNDEVSHSIIISGESGAGKTETAKIALQYLVFVGTIGGMESEILQTNCILEAFGNAKTARNDNSSRFGKLTEIYFNASGEICGAKIQTYLLEKSRVVQLAQGERSYHIFYQLCTGVPSDLRDRLRLKRACDYFYLNQSDCLEIHGFDDAKQFHMVMGALNSLKIYKDDQLNVFAMVAAVLWLGNISFVSVDSENHIDVVADEAVANAAALIGCSIEELMLTLSTHSVVAAKDKVFKRLMLQQAIDRRDSLAMFIYGSLFDWLVEKINVSLAMGKDRTGRSINILDIFGFESFRKNNFEQLCINYANERLQQHFNRQLFKLPQEEYELDGIDWTRIDFEDNLECLDLFEKKPLGLISLLDEELKFPKATDLTLGTKLKQHLNTNRCFKGELGGAFRVRHHAGEVLYDTVGFLQKNRDSLHSENFQLLSSCTSQLPQLFASMLKDSQKLTSSSVHMGMLAHRKQSVAMKFKDQLFKLMQHLENTTPHFIHCIKPNSKRIPGAFEKDLVLEQLRCCGAVNIVRILKCGYPTQMTHQEFARKYEFLLPENNAHLDSLSKSVAILRQFDIPPEMYQVGFMKLYFRAGQIDVLEKGREHVQQGTLEVHKCFHGHCAHQKELEQGIVILQSLIRGRLVRRHFNRLRRAKRSRTSEVKDLPPEMLPSIVEELRKQVSMAEVKLESKKKENAALREQVQQFEPRWSQFQSKMKSMEEMWKKQVASLQMSLDAARKSLGIDNTMHEAEKVHGTLFALFSDSEDTSLVPQTPGGITPARIVNDVNHAVAGENTNNSSNPESLNPVSFLVKEFEQRKRSFNEEAQVIAEVRSEEAPSANPTEDLQKLKHGFETWSKDFKFSLKKAKGKVSRKPGWKWWAKKAKRLPSI